MTSLETLHHDVKIKKVLMIMHKLYHQGKTTLQLFCLFWHFKNRGLSGLSEFPRQPTFRTNKKWKNQTEERIDLWQITAFSFSLEHTKGKQRVEEEDEGGFKAGDGAIWSQHMDTHETWTHITRLVYEQEEGVWCMSRAWSSEGGTRRCNPPTPARRYPLVPFVCHLKLAERSGSQGPT